MNQKSLPPCRGGTFFPPTGRHSIPRIPLIQALAVLLAEAPELGLEILLLVMLGLIADIFPDRLDVHRTDAEFAVAALPCEVGIPWVESFDPTRRRGLDLLDNLRRGVVLGLRKQDVDVFGHGVDFDERRVVIPQDADDVGVEFATFFVAQERTAGLRGEHEVDNNVGKGLGHEVPPLQGLGHLRGFTRPFRPGYHMMDFRP